MRVLCRAGKWWWVNRSPPGLHCPPTTHTLTHAHTHTHTHKHIHTHGCYCSLLHVFPCLPASWAPALPAGTFLPRPCQISLYSRSLLLCFHCPLFLYYPPSSVCVCLCVLSIMLLSTPDLPGCTKHNMTHGQGNVTAALWQVLVK